MPVNHATCPGSKRALLVLPKMWNGEFAIMTENIRNLQIARIKACLKEINELREFQQTLFESPIDSTNVNETIQELDKKIREIWTEIKEKVLKILVQDFLEKENIVKPGGHNG